MGAVSLHRGAAAVAAAALGAALLAPAAETGPDASWLLQVAPGALPSVVEDLRDRGMTVTRSLAGVGMAVVEAPATAAQRLARDPRVTGVTADSGVTLHSSTFDAKDDVNSAYNISRTIGARGMWASGGGGKVQWTGKGVDVALVDSGVSPVAGLDGPGKVVQGPDLSFDSQDPATRHLDGFGHGTHMAGLIAGRDADADPGRPGDAKPFLGMAPDARVVSVKVGDAFGNADVSQVIAGIDWVVQHRRSNGLNVRVLNLSLGTPSTQASALDPLSYAVEQAWHKGLVVVVSAGNDGTGTGQLLNPARNPYVIAVGANDSKGTIPTDDDVIPDFSTRGDGVRNPDLVAPGASVQSLRVPGSYLDEQHPAARVGERFFRGSGTSQAAAVTSGSIALLLQQRPELTPDQVKQLLLTGTRELPAADRQSQGKGMLDLRRPAGASPSAGSAQKHARAKGNGSLDAARGGYRVEDEVGNVLDGERDIFAKAFDAAAHVGRSGKGAAWDGGRWNGSQWVGDGWAASGWSGTAWSGTDWAGRAWAGRAWAGRAWAGEAWNGRAWADGYWSGRAWAGRAWAGRAWATGTWG